MINVPKNTAKPTTIYDPPPSSPHCKPSLPFVIYFANKAVKGADRQAVPKANTICKTKSCHGLEIIRYKILPKA